MSSIPPPPADDSRENQGWGQAPPPPPPPPADGPAGGWQSAPTGWGAAAPGAPGTYPAYAGGSVVAGWPLATWGQRVLATLLDWLLTVPFAIVGGIAMLIPLARAGEMDTTAAIGITIGLLFSLAAAAVSIWNLIFRQGRTGQSVGKSVIGIRVAREADGRPQGALMSLVRAILHSAIDGALCYLGYLWPLWDEKRQTFTDKILSTVVVDVKAGAPSA